MTNKNKFVLRQGETLFIKTVLTGRMLQTQDLQASQISNIKRLLERGVSKTSRYFRQAVGEQVTKSGHSIGNVSLCGLPILKCFAP